MIDDETMQVVRAVLAQDKRPWRSLPDLEDRYLAEILFKEWREKDARAVADIARDLGFEVVEGESLQKSDDGHKLISLLIEYGPKVLAFASAVKTMLAIPDTVRKLRKKVAPYLGKAENVVPQLQLPLLVEWLDLTYGPQKWKVDTLRVQVQIVGRSMLFLVPESTSGRTHLLIAHGNEVEELPGDLIPKG